MARIGERFENEQGHKFIDQYIQRNVEYAKLATREFPLRPAAPVPMEEVEGAKVDHQNKKKRHNKINRYIIQYQIFSLGNFF